MATAQITPEDAQANINPYKVPAMIWDLISTYFVSKYKIKVSDLDPQTPVDGVTVVWRVFRRTPGRVGSSIHGKGPNFTGYRTKDEDGNLVSVFTQTQTVLIEYMVYGTSTDEVESVAWDLENAVLETEGEIQKVLGGFQISFDQQTIDTSLSWRQQDDLVIRTVRFEALIQVKYLKSSPSLRSVYLTKIFGRLRLDQQRFTRDTSNTKFYIPVDDDQTVLSVLQVYAISGTTRKPLIMKTDYYVDADSEGVYLEWIDDYGVTPGVGEDFIVDYEIAPLVITTPLTTSK